MSAASAVALASVAACVPTLELPDEGELARVHATVRAFCALAQSREPAAAAAVFRKPLGPQLERLLVAARAVPLTSFPALTCEPGRVWYKGGSRSFAEVRLAGGSDRLVLWRGTGPQAANVLYGRPVEAAGRRVRDLEAVLAVLGPAGPTGS